MKTKRYGESIKNNNNNNNIKNNNNNNNDKYNQFKSK